MRGGRRVEVGRLHHSACSHESGVKTASNETIPACRQRLGRRAAAEHTDLAGNHPGAVSGNGSSFDLDVVAGFQRGSGSPHKKAGVAVLDE